MNGSLHVQLKQPAGRHCQLIYYDPTTGKRIRVSAGTADPERAEIVRQELEARLRLKLRVPRKTQTDIAEAITWDDFRHEYRVQKVDFMRPNAAADAESRLDIAERILRPELLTDVASTEALERLQRQLLTGAESRHQRPRSTATVRGYVKAVRAALSFAKRKRWIVAVPDIEMISVEESDVMKGRPLLAEEVDRMLKATELIVGETRAASWQRVIRGVVNSGLRMGELMELSWDIPQTIQATWQPGRLPVLWFPAHTQKNKRTQEIPLCPWLEDLLLETPPELRTGWVFNPESIQGLRGRRGPARLSADRVGKIITKIGQRAGVIVDQGNPRTGSPVKFASLHDLRRTFAQRLADSNLEPKLVQRLMRHADIRTTERYYQVANVQRDAGRIRESLSPRNGRGDVDHPNPLAHS